MKAQRSRTAKSKDAAAGASAHGAEPETGSAIPFEQIARLAYSYWEARGSQGGSPEEDWTRAEEELRRQAAPPPATKASAAG